MITSDSKTSTPEATERSNAPIDCATVAVLLNRRIDAIEESIKEVKTPKRVWLEITKVLAPVISSIAVLVIGYRLTGSVENAVSRQQVQVENVKEMRELLVQLGSQGSSIEQLRATSLSLAAFGQYATPSLIIMLDVGGETKVLAAKEGLRAIGFSHPEAVCDQLGKVISNRTALFKWETQLWAIDLTGELDCINLKGVLRELIVELEKSIGNPDASPYAQFVRTSPKPRTENVKALLAEAKRNLEYLNRSNK